VTLKVLRRIRRIHCSAANVHGRSLLSAMDFSLAHSIAAPRCQRQSPSKRLTRDSCVVDQMLWVPMPEAILDRPQIIPPVGEEEAT
jgi:hypothetical protein